MHACTDTCDGIHMRLLVGQRLRCMIFTIVGVYKSGGFSTVFRFAFDVQPFEVKPLPLRFVLVWMDAAINRRHLQGWPCP